MNFFLNKKVGILGLSRTGISSMKFLKRRGFDVFGWDDNKEVLSKVSEAHPASNLASQYGKKSVKDTQIDSVIKKHRAKKAGKKV